MPGMTHQSPSARAGSPATPADGGRRGAGRGGLAPGVALAWLAGLLGGVGVGGLGAGGCGDAKAPPPAPVVRRAAVAPPLMNPAGFCRDSCPRKVRCRLGRVAAHLFEQEVSRCRADCLRWIRDHAEEAVAAARCYEKSGCSVLRACLAEVHRIVADRKIPAKVKECVDLCGTIGTCQGDATDCTLRCRTGDVPMYRALLRCAGKRCPQVRACVEASLAAP